MKKSQEKKARSSAFQRLLKRVEDLGSAWESGNQNVKQVRKRYDEAVNDFEAQASDIAKQARQALRLKKKQAAEAVAEAKKNKKAKAKDGDKKSGKAKAAKSAKAKKDGGKKNKKAESGNKKSGKAKAAKAKKSDKQKAATKKSTTASKSKQKSTGKKSGEKKSKGWGNGIAAVPTPRKKVAADFVAETRAESSKAPVKKEDLRLVTGIGAAIETKLNEAGIYTLQHLANASVPRLQNILNEAGAYFRRFDPKSWPTQARKIDNSDGGRLN